MRADLLERYQALPLPTTNDEHWRFTDLRGFDPAAFTANGATSVERASGMLDVDAAAIAHVSEGGIEIERVPEGVVFAHDTIDSGVFHLATFHDPDGNALQLHRRYAP